jgi:hypothetical protein
MSQMKPVLVSCPDLIRVFRPLHQDEKGEVEYLIDVWLACVPEINVAQRSILEKLPYDGYDPRTDHVTRRWVFATTLFKWIQVRDMLNGQVNYGI